MTDFFRTILDWVYSFVNNYGWSVILFSLLIKFVLLPLDVKSRRSMRAMQRLVPQTEALKRKYGDDPRKLNLKTQELYRANRVSPLGGCLPLLIQLPLLWFMFDAMRSAAAEQQFAQILEWMRAFIVEVGEDGQEVFKSLDVIQAGIADGVIPQMPTFDSWLWVTNVFQPDSFMKSVMPTTTDILNNLKTYGSALSEADYRLLNLFAAQGSEIGMYFDRLLGMATNGDRIDIFFSFISITWPRNWSLANGYLILPILAALSQYVSTLLQPTTNQTAAANAPANGAATTPAPGTGNFMKYFFPIFSFIICLSSTTAFAIYWVFVNLWTIATSFVINKVLDRQEAMTSTAVVE